MMIWWPPKKPDTHEFTVDLVITTLVGLVHHAFYHANYNGNSMELPWDYHGITMVICMVKYRGLVSAATTHFTMIIPWNSHGNTMEFPWDYYDITTKTVVLPRYYRGKTNKPTWIYHGKTRLLTSHLPTFPNWNDEKHVWNIHMERWIRRNLDEISMKQ